MDTQTTTGDGQQQAQPTQAAAPTQTTEQSADGKKANSAAAWRRRIDRCKKDRKELITDWSYNVDYRRGKPFDQESDEDRVNVNLDWGLTKSKHAQLFSQVPQVYLTPKRKQSAPAVAVFAKKLNDMLTDGGLGPACDEAVVDTINAAGIGFALVDYQATVEKKLMPKIDISKLPPEQARQMLQSKQIEMEEMPVPVNKLFRVRRFSPSDALWPTEFTGSNFDDADWLGHSGTMLWDEAQVAFNLKPEDREAIVGSKNKRETLRQQEGDVAKDSEDVVEFDEIFYWAYRFDAEEKYFKRINRIVFVKGKTEPVIHERWKGQRFNRETRKYTGACKFPIRVLTFTYISDDAIPPSDSAIGRPQVDEMIRSRSQIVMQRDRSQPLRWFNTNLFDPQVADSFMRGTYEGALPVNGDGERALGEIARASYPREDFEFDRIIRQDLTDQWQVSPNQMGQFNSGRRTAAEANAVASNTQTRIGYERARVGSFITGIAEVMAGLVALYGDFDDLEPDEQERLKTWDRTQISDEVAFSIRPDSTILLDSNQRVEKLMRVLNLVGKSGYVNPKPIIAEVIELHGIDPASIVIDPPPPPPPKPNISYRFSGVQDLSNPLSVALLMKSGEAPTPEELNAAKMLLEAVGTPIQPPQQQQGPPGPGGPGGPGHNGPPPPQPPGDSRPHWGGMPKVIKRAQDM